MKTFHDQTGKEWRIIINVAAVKRVRDLCGVNLMDVIKVEDNRISADLVDRIANDPVLLVDIVYSLCLPQAQEDGVTDIQFGERMVGDTVEAATNALLEELVNFFPEAKKKILRLILDATSRIRANAAVRLDKMIAETDLQAVIDRVESAASGSFTNSPESAE